MAYEPIITNNAQNKMVQWQVSQTEILAAFNSSLTETGIVPGSTVGIYRMQGEEVCTMYTKSPKGQWLIISCWKRKHM